MAQLSNRVGSLMLAGAGALITLKSCLYVVPPGFRAVVFDRLSGLKEATLGEGLHFRIPIIQEFHKYETRTRYKLLESPTVVTKDMQSVGIGLRLLFKPDPSKLSWIHDTLGTDYSRRVFSSIGNDVMKSVAAQFEAEELITQREMVSNLIAETLTDRSKHFNMIIEDVALVEIHFSKEYVRAIEAKQVAQQSAERAKALVQRTDQEALADIIRAQGEAQANRLLTDAMESSTTFLELRQLEATKEIVKNLSKNKGISYIPGGGNVLMNLGNWNNQNRN